MTRPFWSPDWAEPKPENHIPLLSREDDGPFVVPRGKVRLRKALAKMSGYFWEQCPRCGYYFAGFETGRESEPMHPDDPGYDPQQTIMVCRWCAPHA